MPTPNVLNLLDIASGLCTVIMFCEYCLTSNIHI